MSEQVLAAPAEGRISGSAAIERAALRSDRFRLEREGDWARLERIVVRVEKGRWRKLPDDDLLALPGLYRSVASGLAIARETSLDAATLAYLESLVQRAWYVVYGPRTSLGGWLANFFLGGWGAAVRSIWKDIWIAFAVMLAGVLVGWLLVAHDQSWFYALMTTSPGDVRVPGASHDALVKSLFDQTQKNGLSIFAAQLFSNNAQVSILAFAFGFAFGVPTLMLLVQNMAQLGALLWLYHGQGLSLDFMGWIAVHGTTEISAILLAGAAGLHVGRSMAFPGNRPVLTAAAEAGRRAATVMVGAVLMLICAALLEGFARQLVNDTLGRYAIGGFMLLFWISYLALFRGRGGAAVRSGA